MRKPAFLISLFLKHQQFQALKELKETTQGIYLPIHPANPVSNVTEKNKTKLGDCCSNPVF